MNLKADDDLPQSSTAPRMSFGFRSGFAASFITNGVSP